MNKMIVNHLDKLFVTNDAATIIRELEVAHPAAKMLIMASQQQEHEVGDGTNFVIVFAGTLLDKAEALLKMGLSTAEVIEGFELAQAKAAEELQTLTCHTVGDFRNKDVRLRVPPPPPPPFAAYRHPLPSSQLSILLVFGCCFSSLYPFLTPLAALSHNRTAKTIL